MRPPRPLAAVLGAGLLTAPGCAAQVPGAEWTDQFTLERQELRPTGSNPFFLLEPGHQLVLEDGRDRLTITVLAQTRVVDGVETRVVEERETSGDALVEVSRNYFAISARTNAVFYFGEEVDIYQNGVITSHEGAWLAGGGGGGGGLMMPGLPLVGSRYYQEIAPGVAMDRAQIVVTDATLATPAGSLTGGLRDE